MQNAQMSGWSWKLLLPLACSCAPWIFWFTVAVRATEPSAVEGNLYLAAFLGIGSFLVTAPLASAQLRLLPREGKLTVGIYATLYYLISAPTLSFQALAMSVSVLSAFIPGNLEISNTIRTGALTALLGVGIYAVVAILMNLFITKVTARTV